MFSNQRITRIMKVLSVPVVIAVCVSVLGCTRGSSLTGETSLEQYSDLDDTAYRVRIRWQTESEDESFGYFIHRADSEDAKEADYTCLNRETPVEAAGTTTIPYKYTFYDLNVDPDRKYFYKLQLLNLDGSLEWVFGHPTGLGATSKPINKGEVQLIQSNGLSYREQNF